MASNPSAELDFWKEITLCLQIKPHPNICLILGVVMEEPHPLCIVSEFVAGGNLLHFLQNDQTWKKGGQILKFAHDIAIGMHHLHVSDSMGKRLML